MALVLVVQMALMPRLLSDPARHAPWYNATGITLYVLGMMAGGAGAGRIYLMQQGFGWVSIVRLGAVQAAIGSIVMLATSLLNRVMVVEYGLAAAIPAVLVAWHYAVQLSRPVWGAWL